MRENFILPSTVLCPICRADMYSDGASVFCRGAKKHCFDISKEGYINLLPPGSARNARTGDGADMIRARAEFLSLGGYDEYSRRAAAFAAKYLPNGDITMIDAGCGEGHHTALMAKTLHSLIDKKITACGFDASKHGAAYGAKRYLRERGNGINYFFCAANIFSLPLRERSADLFCSLFAPLPNEEAGRVLKDGGVLLICGAGAGHLYELREILYDTPITSDGGATLPSGFEQADATVIEYKLNLSSKEEIQSLFVMTPFFHNATAQGRERLAAKNSLTVTVQVNCTVGIKV